MNYFGCNICGRDSSAIRGCNEPGCAFNEATHVRPETSITKLIAEIDALAEKAAKRPWYRETYGSAGIYAGDELSRDMVIYDEGGHSKNDADFIVTLVNAWPQLREMARDAERYRWLRERFNGDTWLEHTLAEFVPYEAGPDSVITDGEFDKAIDAAIAAGREK